MAVLTGMFFDDFHPVSAEDEAQIAALQNHVGCRLSTRRAPGILMTVTGVSGEEDPETKLVSSAAGNICAWDGRLDNRSELAARFGDSLADAGSSAAGLALAVYEALGPAALVYLMGDWSLVIWDTGTREIVLASDYAGIRPLYYHRTTGKLQWSSRLEHLSAWSSVCEEDPGYIAGFLAHGRAPGHTPYRGIVPVPSGSFVRIGRDRTSERPFWQLPTWSQNAGHVGETECAEQLRTLLEQAVAARLDTPAPVCAELSGGMDSSSIVCMGSRLVREGRVRAPRLVPFSYDQPESIDQKFIGAVEQHLNLATRHIDLADCPPISEQSFDCATPVWWAPRFRMVARHMEELGSGMLLTGQLGDLVMGNWLDDSEQVADHLCGWRWGTAVQEAFLWSQALQRPLAHILPRAVLLAAVPARAGSRFSPERNLPGACDDSLTRKTRSMVDEQYRSRPQPEWLAGALPSRRKRLLALWDALSGRILECPASLEHIGWSHPFAHRPLVEFMMSLPSGMVCRPGNPRGLMRAALAGVLPEEVRCRRSKGVYDATFLGALRPFAGRLIRSVRKMRLIELGYIDPLSLETRLSRLLHGLECNEPQLRQVILLEFWRRQRDTRLFW